MSAQDKVTQARENAMRLNRILSLVPVVALLLVASAPASAQRGGLGLGISKVGKHSSVSIGIGIGIGNRGGFHHGGLYRDRYFYDRCWVPGHYETVCEQVWIPGCGCERQVWVEPVYQTICEPCCGTRQVLVTAGYYRTVVESAGHFETRTRQVWVPGYYQ